MLVIMPTLPEFFPIVYPFAVIPILSLERASQDFETDVSTPTSTFTSLILVSCCASTSARSRGTSPCATSSKRSELLILICQSSKPPIGNDG